MTEHDELTGGAVDNDHADVETVVAYTIVDRLVLWCGLPLAGAAVGWVLKLLAGGPRGCRGCRSRGRSS